MRIEPWDPADEKAVLAGHEVHCAASRLDNPVEPPMSEGIFRVFMAEGWGSEPGESWVARDDAGAVAGYCRPLSGAAARRPDAIAVLAIRPPCEDIGGYEGSPPPRRHQS